MYRVVAMILGCLMLVPMALAHGNGAHVMGTVKNISASTITVQTADMKTVEVTVTEKTTFLKSGQPAALHDLVVGDRVVIHAGKSGDKMTAQTVSFGPNAPTSSHAAAKK